jgi:MoaD family protein
VASFEIGDLLENRLLMWDRFKAEIEEISLEKNLRREDCGEGISQIMKIKVKFFATFGKLFGGGKKEIEMEGGSNILDLLNLLCDSRQRRQEIFDRSGKPKTYIQILKNRRPIQSLDGIHTELGEGDVVTILPPVAGG